MHGRDHRLGSRPAGVAAGRVGRDNWARDQAGEQIVNGNYRAAAASYVHPPASGSWDPQATSGAQHGSHTAWQWRTGAAWDMINPEAAQNWRLPTESAFRHSGEGNRLPLDQAASGPPARADRQDGLRAFTTGALARSAPLQFVPRFPSPEVPIADQRFSLHEWSRTCTLIRTQRATGEQRLRQRTSRGGAGNADGVSPGQARQALLAASNKLTFWQSPDSLAGISTRPWTRLRVLASDSRRLERWLR